MTEITDLLENIRESSRVLDEMDIEIENMELKLAIAKSTREAQRELVLDNIRNLRLLYEEM